MGDFPDSTDHISQDPDASHVTSNTFKKSGRRITGAPVINLFTSLKIFVAAGVH